MAETCLLRSKLEIVREHEFSVSVGPYDHCLSACFFIWAAAPEGGVLSKRRADVTAKIGVHQSSLLGIADPTTSLNGAKLLRIWGIVPRSPTR